MNIAQGSVLALLAAFGIAASAQAAVSVLGNGEAHSCFVQAEYSDDAKSGVELCTDALKNTVLSGIDRASTLINRGILRARTGDADGALADYAAALATGANDAEAYLNRSATMIALKRYEDARKDASQAIALHSKRLEIAYYNRGIANESLGDIGAAYQDYKAALAVEPRFVAASDQLMRFKVVSDDAKGT